MRLIISIIRWFFTPDWRQAKLFLLGVLLLVAMGAVHRATLSWSIAQDPRNQDFATWAGEDSAEKASLITVQRDPCPGAPFILPTDGFIGLLFADPRGPYSTAHRHQGIDIFTDQDPGVQPVYAAYDGYISRDASWVSSVIQRVPSDPLNPTQQIWIYYTHMADEDGNDFIEPAFDRGVRELFVKQGTLLGYVGDYDGNKPSQIWTHLHLSVVLDDNGSFANEYFIDNTLDPSIYLGIDVHYDSAEAGAATCRNR
ncbi:MAG: hypothetical protein ACPG8W_04245 [Candidatus Promineifilaceae bacterium]